MKTKKEISKKNSGINSAWFGRHHTEEEKRKITGRPPKIRKVLDEI